MSSPESSDSDDITEAGLSREILRLALPAAVQNILQTAMFWVDTKMVARYAQSVSSDPERQAIPLAALAVTGPLMWSLTVIATLTAVGTTALVGRRVGERNLPEARSVVGTAAIIAFLAGLFVAVPGAFLADELVRTVLSWSPQPHAPELIASATAYFWWFAVLFPFRSMAITLEAALRGAGDTTTPLLGGGVANLVNLGTNAVLIFGLWGAPRLGVEGAGVGVALASVGECVFLYALLVRGRVRRLPMHWRDFVTFSREKARSIVTISLPALIDAVVFHAGFMIYQLAIYWLDETQIAAHRVAITLQSAAFMPAAGFYSAAASLSGRLLGAGKVELARTAGRRTALFGVTSMVPVVLLFWWGAEPLAWFFSDGNRAVTILAASCLRIGAFEVPFLMATESLRGTLRGAGETRQPVIVTALGTWLVRVPGSWLLGVTLGWGLRGIWITTVIDWLLRASVLAWLFRGGRWTRHRL